MKIANEQKFRSRPAINTDPDMVRFTIDCNFYEARKLREIVKGHDQKNIIDTFNYVDPNDGLNILSWTKLFASNKSKAEAFKEGKFRFENWVWGVPGSDDGWATVSRWLYFVGLELKPKIILRLGGMCELREKDSNEIHRQFLGDHHEPA